MQKITFSFAALLAFSTGIFAQTPTLGLIQHDPGSNDNGYVLFDPIQSDTAYLIDKCGKKLHTWHSAYTPGQSLYLLADGSLLRTGNVGNTFFNAGGKGGIIEKLDWNSNITWTYTISDNLQCQHHDIRPLPNGNILVIAWEKKTVAAATAAGRDPSLLGNSLWSEKIVELQPVGNDSANIVWEWHLWDHLVQDYDSTKANFGVIADNPQLVNLNFAATMNMDWIHMNAIDYNPDLDQVLLSSHNFDEIWIIDHSTTTAEAAGHTGGNSGKGGDLLYRWGNEQAYGYGSSMTQKFFGQHNPHWIENGLPDAGKIMVFNNGQGRPAGNYSTVDIIDPPVDGNGNYASSLPYGPVAQSWVYTAANPTDFFSVNISGAQQLDDGNILICEGQTGHFFEIDSLGNKVWDYISPVSGTGILSQGSSPVQNSCFRCSFYRSDFSGFASHTFTAGDPVELNPYSYVCSLTGITEAQTALHSFTLAPNPAGETVHITSGEEQMQELQLLDLSGRIIMTMTVNANSFDLSLSGFSKGIYIVQAITAKHSVLREKLVVE